MNAGEKVKKPVGIIYGVEDRPPFWAAVPVVMQQLIFLSLDLIFPVLLVQSIMGSTLLSQSFVSLTMFAMGTGTILQSLKKGPVGSGYFCPQETGVIYLPAAMLAVQKGGFPLLLGMTSLAGLAEIVFAKILNKVRFLFPAELAGLVVAMLGIIIIPLSVGLICGSDAKGATVDIQALKVGFLTLGVTVGLNVWGKGILRQYSILIGIIFGYLCAYYFGVLTNADLVQVLQAPLLALPDISHIGWSFSPELIVPFLIAMLCSALKTLGNVTICQKSNDAEWKRLNMTSVEGGLIADGLSTFIAGLIGGMGQNSSSGGIGLNVAAGVTSRIIGFIVGGCFFLLAFVPKLSALFSIMPKPVMGAILIISSVFVLIAGFQIMLSRMLDTRKTFMIGLALVFGLSVDLLPALFDNVPHTLRALFSSSFSLATLIAILLNLLFRLGVAQTRRITLKPGNFTADTVFDFMEQAGSAWGARREIVNRARAALYEFLEAAESLALADGPLKVEATFDEYNLDIDVYYQGREMAFPATRPTEAELLEDEQAFVRLAGFMVRKYADKVQADDRNGMHHVRFHFEH